MHFNDIKLFLPEITLVIGSILILLCGIFFNDKTKTNKKVFYISLITLFLSFYFCIFVIEPKTTLFNGLLVNNYYTLFFKTIVFSGTIVITLFSYNYLRDLKILNPEYFFLILLSLVGILLLLSSNNILSMYLGLEMQSICLYILATYRKYDLKSSEAGVKYFIMGVLSSGILLYGLSLIFAFTNSTDFFEISNVINSSIQNNTNFFHEIALQAKKLYWGEWEWEHSEKHTILTVTTGPFVTNHAGMGPVISFYGPIRGVVRAAIYALGNPASDTIHHRIEPGRIIYQHHQAH